MANDLRFSAVRGERNRNEPVRYFLQLTTPSGRLREVELSVVELSELARGAVICLASTVREASNA